MNDTGTTIKTQINYKYVVTSVFRRFGNDNFEQWAWETIVWDMTKEKYPDIVEQLTENDANEVIIDHSNLFEKYRGLIAKEG